MASLCSGLLATPRTTKEHPPFARTLNETRILTGFPLGYYLASQLSLVIFVIEIFFYAWYMNNVLDPKYGLHEEEARTEDAEP
jgi:putative solute:sodium symporter small subunit